ncbi:MAG: hemolysin III family protein [Erysipelotrichaceae bacterium]|nr:hemolysin III family protein [Erysipelotrichaceae bacterium]
MEELTLRQLNRLDNKPYFSVKDPISALTHFIGFVAAVFLTPLLLIKGAADDRNIMELFSLSAFCLSMMILYAASTAHHSLVLPARPRRVIRKLDHMSIFLLIAGTYTPICVIALKESGGMRMLLAVAVIMIIGLIFKALWINCPKYVSSITYIAMGWLVIFNIGKVYQALVPAGFYLLLAGGILYTIGGIIYALKFSINRDWGHHEIFHLFILLGTLCHYLMIYFFVA